MDTKELKLKDSVILNKLLRATPNIIFFIIFSFMGWIAETIFCFILYGKIIERGFLFAPICPIYGFGALMLILYFNRHSEKKNYIKLFFLFILIFSFFEYLVGFSLEAIFSARWWDYSDNQYSLNGRITFLNSFLWGVATIIFAKFIYPLTNFIKLKFINRIPNLIKIIIDIILLIGIAIDFLLSCKSYLA